MLLVRLLKSDLIEHEGMKKKFCDLIEEKDSTVTEKMLKIEERIDEIKEIINE